MNPHKAFAMHDDDLNALEIGPPPCDPVPVGDGAVRSLRRRRPSATLRAVHPPGQPSGTPAPSPGSGGGSGSGNSPAPQTQRADEDRIHSAGGLSGSEAEVDVDAGDEPSDPEEPPNTPLAEEKRAVVVYAARNLVNTIDIQPVGTAWFSA